MTHLNTKAHYDLETTQSLLVNIRQLSTPSHKKPQSLYAKATVNTARKAPNMMQAHLT